MTDVIRTKARRWGNSIGFVLPASARKELRLKPGQEVEITVKQAKNPLQELWGSMKWDKATDEILRDVRKNESKWL